MASPSSGRHRSRHGSYLLSHSRSSSLKPSRSDSSTISYRSIKSSDICIVEKECSRLPTAEAAVYQTGERCHVVAVIERRPSPAPVLAQPAITVGAEATLPVLVLVRVFDLTQAVWNAGSKGTTILSGTFSRSKKDCVDDQMERIATGDVSSSAN